MFVTVVKCVYFKKNAAKLRKLLHISKFCINFAQNLFFLPTMKHVKWYLTAVLTLLLAVTSSAQTKQYEV